MPRPGSYRVLMKECDDIARERARLRGPCEVCGAVQIQGKRFDWAHGFSRSYHAIRHVDDNGRRLCYKCHGYFSGHHEEDWREWLLAKLGAERFEELRARRNDRCSVVELERTLALLLDGAEVR